MSNCSSGESYCSNLQLLVASSRAELAAGEVLLVSLSVDSEPLLLDEISCDLPGFVVAHGRDLAGNPAKHAVPVDQVSYKDSRILISDENELPAQNMGFVV